MMLRIGSEEGQAVVAGIAISFIVAVLVTTILGLAVHSNDATVADRSRTQGIQSAEAAVSVMIDRLQRNICVPDVGFGGDGPAALTSSGLAIGEYQAIVRLPAEAGSLNPALWDPNNTGAAHCSSPPSDPTRVITAWGYGPHSESHRGVLRKLEVVVRAVPLAGFRFVCFAGGQSPDGNLNVANNMTINGDCYSRTVPANANNFTFTGTMITPGPFTTLNNAVYQGSIWAGGAVSIGNSTTMSGYVTSAASSVTLGPNAVVAGNVTAGTTLTLGNNASVGGVRCPAHSGVPGCPTNPPPDLPMPVPACASTDAACWQSKYPGMQVMSTSAAMTNWLSANQNNLQGAFYVNDPGTTQFTSGGTITGPLTIITRGRIDLSRSLVTPHPAVPPSSCTPQGGPSTCIVSVVALNEASNAIRVLPPRFTANPATISTLLFTTGTLLADNGANPFTYTGVIYAKNLDLNSRGMTFNHSQDLIDFPPPFVDWTLSATSQYAVHPVSWRELPPAVP